MPKIKLNQIVEAMLFASKEPITTKTIAKIIRKVSKREVPDDKLCSVNAKEVEKVVDTLNRSYQKKSSPYIIEERSNGWSLFTRIEYGVYLRELFPDLKPTRLSAPALETLAIVAYRQPITKAAIEAVRGVNVDGVLQSLIERGLVGIGGRADLPGKPFLYETSKNFLEHFGIKNVDDLPNASELRQVELPQPEAEVVDGEQLPLSGVSSSDDRDSNENDDVSVEVSEEKDDDNTPTKE
ncbi:MAG: SMC-Scp complex subunit ScpB [Verrucomicrobiaceae bacterium]|nr:MAG: SMC-Scp complex subunit ScpB [Verrucomicrobiaceae bacterium]